MASLCEVTEDCVWNYVCSSGVCVHKPLLPLSVPDVLLGVVIFLFTGIANAAGIAGASVLIPIAILMGNFTSHMAIPMINTAVFGGVIVATAMRMQLRHLVADKPRIDYDVAMHLCMPMMLGAVGGVMLNIILPGWVILGLLLIVLGYSAFKILKQAIDLQRLGPVQEPFMERMTQDISSELRTIYQEEAKLAPCKQLVWVGVMLFIVSLSVFLRGGKGIQSILGFAPCSMEYWIATSFFVITCGFFMWLTSTTLIKQTVYLKSLGYPYGKGDFYWSVSQCLLVIAAGLFTGLISGLFGIAGGVILIPILLSLKMRPEVANATSSFLTFFTNFTTFLQFSATGKVPFGYAGVYFIVSMLGSLVGVTLLEKVVRKMQSATVFLLGIVLVIAFALIPIYEVPNIIAHVHDGTFYFGFRDFC